MRQIKLGDLQITNKFRGYVEEILDTGRVSYGKFSRMLEGEMARYHGAKYGILSNSGTSSLQVALHALKIQNNWADSSEVVVPATTFPATINVILQNRLKPVFVDVDKDFYDINIDQLENEITDKTVALLPVNLFGQTCRLDEIKNIADFYNLKTVVDSCETIGVGHNRNPLADYADVVCFSFYVAHIIQGGVGGVGITKDDELAKLMRSLVNHGRRPTYISIDDMPVNLTDRFTFDHTGYSYRITEFESALALSNFRDIGANIARRREIAACYKHNLSKLDFLQIPAERPVSEHSWMMYPLVIKDPGIDKLRLCKYLEDNGIETRDMLPLTNQPVACKHYDITIGDFPVSDNLVENGFYISCSNHLTNEDIAYVIAVFSVYQEN